MEYCSNKSKARVNFTFAGKREDNVTSSHPPINVVTTGATNSAESSAKCWRFTGQGVGNDFFYEYFACGTTPSFNSNGNATGLYMDGQRIAGDTYIYREGSYSVAQVYAVSRNSHLESGGNCDNCLSNSCSITISDTTGNILTKSGNCPINFKVYCDNECPPDHLRCETTNYPGYCCIPCGSVKSEISAIKAMIRSMKNG